MGVIQADEKQRQKQLQINRRKPLLVGNQRSPKATVLSRDGCARISAAKPLYGKAVYCIDNVNTDTSADQLQKFVENLSVRVLSCYELHPRRTRKQKENSVYPFDRKTFRLCINKADSELLLRAEKWPSDISISAWFFKRSDIRPVAEQLGGDTGPVDVSGVSGNNDTTEVTTVDMTTATSSSPLNPDAPAFNAENSEIHDSDSTMIYGQGT